MKSSSMTTFAVVIAALGAVFGMAYIVIGGSVGFTASSVISTAFTIWVSTFFITIFFVFCSTVLYHLEVLTAQQGGEGNAAEQVAELTVPRRPAKKAAARNKALEKIKGSSFKSTDKIKCGDYLIAIDENSKQWVVVSPDGENSEVRPYSAFEGCSINQDHAGTSCNGIEVMVDYADGDTSTIHIVLYGRNCPLEKTYAEYKKDADAIVNMLEKIKAPVEI